MNLACVRCSEPLKAALPYCEHCGAVQPPAMDYECETHTERPAVGMCVVCYRPVCETCETIVGGRIVCGDSSHRQLIDDWSVVRQVESEFEADALQQNLKAADIESRAFSLHDHIAMYFVPIHCAAVWVKQNELQKAIAVLTDLHLLTDIDQT